MVLLSTFLAKASMNLTESLKVFRQPVLKHYMK